MTCSNTGVKGRFAGALKRQRPRQAPHADAAQYDEIAGTWDYKWPRGTVIRVAFQEPSKGDDFDAARKKVEELASSWGVVKGARGDAALMKCLSIEFQPFTLAKPLGKEVPLLANRSPFSLTDPETKPYDVLVSLEPLPLERYDMLAPEGPQANPVLFPISDLGSYARRADYGEPTVHIGPFGSFVNMSLSDYYDQPLARHVVVHEFGHVLGLAHAHQHPAMTRQERERALLPLPEIQKRVQQLVGITPDEPMLLAHLFERWDGTPKFSDWPTQAPKLDELSSVMTFPYLHELLSAAHDCSTIDNCHALHTTPTPSDFHLLRAMYGLAALP